MKKFVHVHSSSRFDRSVESLENAIDYYTQVGSLVTFTEVAAPKRERPVKAVEEWGYILGDKTGRDDAGIIWDTRVWRIVGGYSRLVERSMGVGAVFAVLEHRDTKNRLLVTVCHLPASVEGRNGLERASRRGKAWLAAHKNWRREYNRLAKQHDVDGVLVVADWNLNIKRKLFLPLFKALMPSMRLVFNYKNVPDDGTHHKRWIDFSFIRGKLKVYKWPSLMKDDKSSDHRPYKEILEWTT